MAAWLISIGLYFWELFKTWISTFVLPLENLDMLWLLVPIWITWFFAEFFQEKKGTSMGNAITNAVVVLWGSIDCARQTIRLISAGELTSMLGIILRFLILVIILSYGILIIVWGIKGKKAIKRIGRIRVVTYAFVMFTPVFYNVVPLTFTRIFAVILFFPLFYYLIELIDRFTPNPKAIMEDEGASSGKDFGLGSSGDLGLGGLGKMK